MITTIENASGSRTKYLMLQLLRPLVLLLFIFINYVFYINDLYIYVVYAFAVIGALTVLSIIGLLFAVGLSIQRKGW